MAIEHKDLKKVVGELEGAVKAHGRQAKTIKQHIKDMGSSFKMKKSPFAKKKGRDGKACWKGYTLRGTKKKGGRTVDNCVKVKRRKK